MKMRFANSQKNAANFGALHALKKCLDARCAMENAKKSSCARFAKRLARTASFIPASVIAAWIHTEKTLTSAMN